MEENNIQSPEQEVQEDSVKDEENSTPSSEQENAENDKNKDENISIKDFLEILETTLITVFCIVMLFTYILHPVNVVGHSMVPTLNKNVSDTSNKTDRIFMTTVYSNIKYGDIIIINNDENHLIDENGNVYIPENVNPLNECIIKRVIATGGQTIELRDSKVYVDGELLDEPYINAGSTTYDLGAFGNQYPFTVPEGYYFVMGDNRNRSSDSRAPQVGLVAKEQIYGKAIIKYYPFSEFDILTDSWKESAND